MDRDDLECWLFLLVFKVLDLIDRRLDLLLARLTNLDSLLVVDIAIDVVEELGPEIDPELLTLAVGFFDLLVVRHDLIVLRTIVVGYDVHDLRSQLVLLTERVHRELLAIHD